MIGRRRCALHELALTHSIIKTVLGEMQRRSLPRVEIIGLKVGILSGAVPEALEFCFEAISTDTPLAGTRLEIEPVSIRVRCLACDIESGIEKYFFVCPQCDSRDIEIISGEELDIAYLQVADEENNAAAATTATQVARTRQGKEQVAP